jgi:small multidrug resistance pump
VIGDMPVAALLSFAIVSEVAATVALRYSDGFTRPGPVAVVVAGYGVSFWLLALVLREMSIGTTYAVWSAAGTALIAAVGILAFGEPATALKVGSLGLIILGVVGLNLAGGTP